jgi:MarC family membrane protein
LANEVKNDLQAIATIFSLVNPGVCAAIFMQVEKGRPQKARALDATRAILAVLFILAVAAFFGTRILDVFGVSLDAFSVAGGGVLTWIGISMLTGHATPTTPDQNQASAAEPSLAPLILFAASPGTITGVITIAASHSKLALPVTAIAAIVIVLALTWLLLLATARMRDTGEGGLGREMITRYMGLIVVAMGIQFILTGFKAFMAHG